MVPKDYKPLLSDICIAPKTSAIVCQQNADSDDHVSGEKLFSKLRRVNSKCSWDEAFRHAMKKIVYVGSLRPHTLLIYGTTDHVETLKNAWARNILRSPDGFSILYFGELQPLYIETVGRASFTPLPDALCSIILHMNQTNRSATLTSLKSQLEQHYSHAQTPSDQIVFEALNNLVKEKKAILTDSGYFVTEHRTEALSVLFSKDKNGISSPDACKTEHKNNNKTSPRKMQPLRRSKSANEKVERVRVTKTHYANNNNEKLSNKNAWNNERNGLPLQQKKPKVKGTDKGAAIRKLFGFKDKKKVQKASSTGSRSSTQSLSADDEPVQQTAVPYCLDSRNTSQLTSAAVPFILSPMSSSDTANDSMLAHCGRTVLYHQSATSDSEELDTDYSEEENDEVPELLAPPIRTIPHRCAINVQTKRQISNPFEGWRQRHTLGSSSTDTTDSTELSVLPTAQMYFERKRNRSMHTRSHSSVTQLPNISSIHNSSVASTAMRVPNSNSTAISSFNTSDGRQSAEGGNTKIAHHSTPKEQTPSCTKQAFNATGHTECEKACCGDHDHTPKQTKRTLRRSSYYHQQDRKRMNNNTTIIQDGCCVCCSSYDCMCSPKDSTEFNRLGEEVCL